MYDDCNCDGPHLGGRNIEVADNDIYNAGDLFGTETGRSDRWALSAFVNRLVPTAANLHLAGSDAVAVDHGMPVSAFIVDTDGDARPQGAAWDIGADEVKRGTSQPPLPRCCPSSQSPESSGAPQSTATKSTP